VSWSRAIEELPTHECWELLGSAGVGRLVYVEDGMPVAHPVNFVRSGGDVVIRTGPGGGLRAAERGDRVAFQRDEIDPDTRTGWSVLLAGRARVVRDVDELVGLIDPYARPWALGRGEQMVRVIGERITGRRLPAEF